MFLLLLLLLLFTSYYNKFQDLQKTVPIDQDKLGKNQHLCVASLYNLYQQQFKPFKLISKVCI